MRQWAEVRPKVKPVLCANAAGILSSWSLLSTRRGTVWFPVVVAAYAAVKTTVGSEKGRKVRESHPASQSRPRFPAAAGLRAVITVPAVRPPWRRG